MKLINPSIASVLLFLGLWSCSVQKHNKSPKEYEPSETTQKILAKIKEKNITESDSTLFPQIVSSLLYRGQNIAGREFAQHTEHVLKNISADTYHELSVQNLKNGDYAEAFKYISKAVEMDPKENAGYFGWILIYYYRDYERALKYLDLYDSFTPNFSDFPSGENIHYLKGIAHMRLGDSTNALNEFDTYIAEERAADAESFIDVAAFIHKGRIHQGMGEMSDAHQAFKKAIELREGCLEAHYFQANLELLTEKYSDASVHIEKAESLYQKQLKSQDIYVELFHEVYMDDIIKLKKLIGSKTQGQ